METAISYSMEMNSFWEGIIVYKIISYINVIYCVRYFTVTTMLSDMSGKGKLIMHRVQLAVKWAIFEKNQIK